MKRKYRNSEIYILCKRIKSELTAMSFVSESNNFSLTAIVLYFNIRIEMNSATPSNGKKLLVKEPIGTRLLTCKGSSYSLVEKLESPLFPSENNFFSEHAWDQGDTSPFALL